MADDTPKLSDYLAEVDEAPSTLSHGRLLYIIHELSRLISTNFDNYMARHNLTHAQWWAIMHLYENQGTSQSDFAAIMQMGRASAGKLLERMEAKGWIERRPDPDDSRIRRVYLAEGVVPMFMLMGEEGNRLFSDLLSDLDPQTEMTVLEGLRAIRRRAEAGLRK